MPRIFVSRLAVRTLVLASSIALLASCAAPPRAAAPSARDSSFAGFLGLSTDLGRLDAATQVPVVVELADPNAGRRAADLAAMLAPASGPAAAPLTPSEYAVRYGLPASTVAPVRAWFANTGLDSTWTPGGASLQVVGSAATVDRVFGTELHRYRSSEGVEFYGSRTDPKVPPALSGAVAGVGRITSYRPKVVTRAVPAGGLAPKDILNAYDIKPLRDAGFDGTGETVVIWGTDGHVQKDLDTWANKFGLPPIQVTEKFDTSVSPSPGGEETMDIEVVHAIAPGAKILVYTPKADNLAGYTETIDAMVDQNPGGIQTHSWGLCEKTWGGTLAQHWLDTMQKAVRLGETVYVASGDRGGFECPPQDWSQPPTRDWLGLGLPDAIPYVTSVGGTRLSVGVDSTWYDETVWVEHARNLGSTGGVSQYYKAGPWQKGKGTQNKFNNGNRMEPDISADSDATSGMAIYIDGEWQQGGGTSQASPIWAGITAVMNHYLKKKGLKGVGFISPALYDLANASPQYAPFHDITVGNNMNFPSTPGYDLATGLGTPDVWNLCRDLEAYQRNGGKP